MTQDQITELKTSIVGELKEIIFEVRDDLRGEMREMDSNLRALITEESIKNAELFGEVFVRLDRIEESLPAMARDMETMRRDIVLLKMAVFGKESIMGQVV